MPATSQLSPSPSGCFGPRRLLSGVQPFTALGRAPSAGHRLPRRWPALHLLSLLTSRIPHTPKVARHVMFSPTVWGGVQHLKLSHRHQVKLLHFLPEGASLPAPQSQNPSALQGLIFSTGPLCKPGPSEVPSPASAGARGPCLQPLLQLRPEPLERPTFMGPLIIYSLPQAFHVGCEEREGDPTSHGKATEAQRGRAAHPR